MWHQEVTPDGKWMYGYGMYKKSTTELAKTADVYQKIATAPLGILGEAIKLVTGTAKTYLKDIDMKTAVPTYYIWARPVKSGEKFVGGEWNILTGGKAAMLDWFKSTFEPCIRMPTPDIGRQQCVWASAGAPKIANAMKVAKAAEEEARTTGMIGGAALPLLIVGAVVLYLSLKR